MGRRLRNIGRTIVRNARPVADIISTIGGIFGLRKGGRVVRDRLPALTKAKRQRTWFRVRGRLQRRK